MSILDKAKVRHEQRRIKEFPILEFLDKCRTNPDLYDNVAKRMLRAIGEPEIVDTRKDERLSRIFTNSKIKRYAPFSEFYGMEKVIEDVVSYFRFAAQNLEEANQILYLLGPVGGGKSSLAEAIKHLAEQLPMYTISIDGEISPVFESPFGLFDYYEDAPELEKEYGIPRKVCKCIPSPWATKRLDEVGGDISKFRVIELYPSILRRIGITKVEPGDENNQDISSMVGKVDIRALEKHSQDDPDAYKFSGGLNRATQCLMEFVEMFKAPQKMLHPLLTATQEHHYNGTEEIAAIPFHGVIIAHSNESEWEKFKNDKNNEAFLDRIYIVKVPYCLQVSEEVKIYEKLIRNSELDGAPIAPGTLRMLAEFAALSRIKEPENSSRYSKMQIYDGENLKEKDPKAKSITEYRDMAGVNEGMDGISTRFAFKVLSKVFNYDPTEVAANPVHLIKVLEEKLDHEGLAPELLDTYKSFIGATLGPKFGEFIGDEIQKAYLESYSEYGQNLFDRYVAYADYWIEGKEYRDQDTGEMFEQDELNDELEKIEKPAGIVNPREFRNEVVRFVMRAAANSEGKMPKWTSYNKLREVIEKKIFSNTEDLLPVISFSKKQSEEEEKKHSKYVDRMCDRGYTARQVRLLTEWYIRFSKHQ